MLRRIQKGLEQLYRVSTGLDIVDFIVSEEDRDNADVDRLSREQLLLQEDADGVALGLFLDSKTLSVLHSLESVPAFHSVNMSEFLLALEGISHFVYASRCIHTERPVSALELELQAEVDKYAACLLSGEDDLADASPYLRKRLFEDFEYVDGLSATESERYRVANDNAKKYSKTLEDKFISNRRVPGLYQELRKFYRMSLREKISFINLAA